ncbi:hypothetical protein KP509_34G003600 [Ceratopteris richardii]|uniref:DNA-directed RNA polymerase subunit n=1 Tax=Ceratopteris richardii TaxID=49495 RepID=A0A8T2QHK8_CERRI|nr:hypothetical protein KP509_34G003600 [Ceratopteris richardii]KAH7283369.1 hypothetical protein KP509_34G003600 [Ceratopteris richardii]
MEVYASLFCSFCGTLLSFNSELAAAVCPLCRSQKDIKELQGKQFWYRTTSEGLARRLGIELLVKPSDLNEQEADETDVPQRAMVNDECPKCHNPQLEYYTRQLRSADEGQTVFYECPNCRYKFAQNM